MKAKELDNISTLLRKGNLEIHPNELEINVSLSVVTGRHKDKSPDFSYDEHDSVDKDMLGKYPKDKKFKLHHRSYGTNEIVTVRKRGNTYSGCFRLMAFTQAKVGVDSKTCENIYKPKYGYRSDLPKAVKDPKLLAEFEQEKTLLEWFQFMRRLRRHFRKAMLDGLLKTCLGRLDKLKVHKDHAGLTAELTLALTELKALAEPLAARIAGIPDKLQPFVEVQPYGGLYHQLGYLEETIKELPETIKGLIDELNGKED